MTRFGAHPEARALVEPLCPFLGVALRALSGRSAGLVVVEEGRDTEPVTHHVGELRVLKIGHSIAAVPLEGLRALVSDLAPALVPKFKQSLRHGETWCFVLSHCGETLAPLVWLSAVGSSAEN